MLILLPPSEGKMSPTTGNPLNLAKLSFPELNEHRKQLLQATMASAKVDNALQIFGVSQKLAPEIRANQTLSANPARPSAEIYTGVLYSALDYASLSNKTEFNQQVLIFSALFGLLRFTDEIPSYRLSGNVQLPQIGKVASSWRGRISLESDFILDCRSGTYQSMWKPKNLSLVKAITQDNKVVTHYAKHARGLVARTLGQLNPAPENLDEAVAALNDIWGKNLQIAHRAKRIGNDLIIITPN